MNLPERIDTIEQLDEFMTRPSPQLVQDLADLQGDLIILGVGGKMGPTLARLARRALDEAGNPARVIGVARFSDPAVRQQLERHGIETLPADLLDDTALAALPDAPNVLYLAARKFGSTGNEAYTWAMNTYLPGRVADRYRSARIVALSTGNVYPLTPADSDGPIEDHPPAPVGEYAQSCLGRERMFQHFSQIHGTKTTLIRLNYAVDLRYGVLFDIGTKVRAGTPIDLAMGHVNVIWQGDANTAILRSFRHATSPPFVLNVTGPGTLRVRELAEAFGRQWSIEPTFTGAEAPTALLNNASRMVELMGPPAVSLKHMIAWVAHWIDIEGATLGKPTHYEARDGRF